jgi:hypothetical protein
VQSLVTDPFSVASAAALTDESHTTFSNRFTDSMASAVDCGDESALRRIVYTTHPAKQVKNGKILRRVRHHPRFLLKQTEKAGLLVNIGMKVVSKEN